MKFPNAVVCFSLLSATHAVADSPQVAEVEDSKLVVRPEEILESKEVDLGDRKMVLQKITPRELPAVPEPAPRAAMTEEQRAEWLLRRQQAKPREWVSLSITVIHDGENPVRTRFQWWSKDRAKTFEAFSNVDGNHLTGTGQIETAAKRYEIMAMVGNQDNVRLAEVFSRSGKTFTRPVIPPIPQGQPAFVVTKGEPTQEELAALQAIHDHFQANGEAMRHAHEERKRLQRERAEFLAANPPQPKDIRLRFWKLPKPAEAGNEGTEEQGGDQ